MPKRLTEEQVEYFHGRRSESANDAQRLLARAYIILRNTTGCGSVADDIRSAGMELYQATGASDDGEPISAKLEDIYNAVK